MFAVRFVAEGITRASAKRARHAQKKKKKRTCRVTCASLRFLFFAFVACQTAERLGRRAEKQWMCACDAAGEAATLSHSRHLNLSSRECRVRVPRSPLVPFLAILFFLFFFAPDVFKVLVSQS